MMRPHPLWLESLVWPSGAQPCVPADRARAVAGQHLAAATSAAVQAGHKPSKARVIHASRVGGRASVRRVQGGDGPDDGVV